MPKVSFRIHLEVIFSFKHFRLLSKECIALSQTGLEPSPFVEYFSYDKHQQRQEKETKEHN